MANISTSQNLQSNIRLLAAQWYLYSCAKRLSATQAFLAGATPITGAITVALWTEAQPWAALAGILVPLLDVGLLDP